MGAVTTLDKGLLLPLRLRIDDDFDNVFENETYGDFSPYEVYAFVAYLTIPSAKPTTSIDAIFLEIGYGSEEPYGRIGMRDTDMHWPSLSLAPPNRISP